MKPIDIKGRPIYSHVFAILQKHGDKLVEMQWKESFNKPNLFYKEFQGLMVFADMRGTEIIPIWDEPCPYLYVNGKVEEDWKKRRSMRKAVEEFDIMGVPHRFSFYEEMAQMDYFLVTNRNLKMENAKCAEQNLIKMASFAQRNVRRRICNLNI